VEEAEAEVVAEAQLVQRDSEAAVVEPEHSPLVSFQQPNFSLSATQSLSRTEQAEAEALPSVQTIQTAQPVQTESLRRSRSVHSF
jgi:hypothetical protein